MVYVPIDPWKMVDSYLWIGKYIPVWIGPMEPAMGEKKLVEKDLFPGDS